MNLICIINDGVISVYDLDGFRESIVNDVSSMINDAEFNMIRHMIYAARKLWNVRNRNYEWHNYKKG